MQGREEKTPSQKEYKENKVEPLITEMQEILKATTTHPDIKKTLKRLCQTREKNNFHAFVSQPQTYLQTRGLGEHNFDQFNYINRMLSSSTDGVIGRIKKKELNVRDLHSEARESQMKKIKIENEVSQQIIAQVEHVINNVDLPISLFKRDDHYWYRDNPKTLQAKQFIHNRQHDDRERKKKLRAESKKRKSQEEKRRRAEKEQQMRMEEERRKKMRDSIQKKIEDLENNRHQRQKSIQESKKFTMALRPMFKQIERNYNQNQMSALQQQKHRLSQVRKLRKSIDLSQISEHHKKLDKLKEQHEGRKIINDPMKVNFKSKYHTSMTTRSRVDENHETVHSLYEKKKEYSRYVSQECKPIVNENLVRQMQERLKIMLRRRTRKNPKKSEGDEEEDDSDEDSEPKKEQKKPEPDPENLSDQDEDEEPKRVRGEDEDPDRQQRYEMGLEYLDFVRNLPKKKPQSPGDDEKKLSIYQLYHQHQKYEPKTERPHYTNYLQQKKHKTIDHINTQKIKPDYYKSIVGQIEPKTLTLSNTKTKQYNRKLEFENDVRHVEEKAKQEEQLLKAKKMKRDEAIEKKIQIDNVVLDTIKARLALIG